MNLVELHSVVLTLILKFKENVLFKAEIEKFFFNYVHSWLLHNVFKKLLEKIFGDKGSWLPTSKQVSLWRKKLKI